VHLDALIVDVPNADKDVLADEIGRFSSAQALIRI